MSSSLTYVYCLVRADRPPAVSRVRDRMPGGQRVRLLDVPGLAPARGSARHWLVVSSVPERIYGERPLQEGLQHLDWVATRAMAHEKVVEAFLTAAALLPMQLFTLFIGDARAVEHVVRNRRRIARLLSRLERHVEWGLRLRWEPSADDGQPTPTQAAPRKKMSGASYLAHKRDLRDRRRLELQRAKRAAARLYRAVADEATAARRRTEVERAASASPLLLDAAFLVPVRRARAFQAAVRRHTAALAPAGISVSLTGPWPAYNFI